MKGRDPNWKGGKSRWGKTYNHICLYCGKIFTSGSSSGNYCSEPCRRKALKEESAKKPNTKTIAEIVKEAEAEGLTYGQYIAKRGG